jgi:DNA repair protein RecO (recombination protein O)
MLLREASLLVPRRHLLGDLAALQAAGRALGWVRHVAPPDTPDLRTWRILNRLLDELNARQQTLRAEHHLAHAGFQLLASFGWPLDLSRCVRCGRSCQPDQKAMVDPAAGGLICRTCGGGQILLDADRRRRLAEAAVGTPALRDLDVPQALDLVEQALQAHAGVNPKSSQTSSA